ncbi:glutathione peroxidase [Gilvimarinus polysaccharolyticus]|uniref:glutathione peroxidase n=1 Tax=Gilvimarinus polysaccharolyticus TaxID=863921 RepID=UPI000673357E|nr:glutathione peroxidase [Gilvimarinus polysaccharolyticus]
MKISIALMVLLGFSASAIQAADCPAYLDADYRKLHASESIHLCDVLAGKDALIVNTASHCGYTPQFKALEALHNQYAERGLVVVGFASDDFKQAAKSEEEAATICYTNYGVTFTMLAPTAVTGAEANDLFEYLGRQSEQPGWNFNKYLLDGETGSVQHFGSKVKPGSVELNKAIEVLLQP